MKYKAFIIPAAGLVLLALGYLVFGGLNENLVYYLTPSEATQQRVDFPDGERFRLGGLVAGGSIVDTSDGVVGFQVVDDGASVDVRYEGAPPQLFRDEVGVVVEGTWSGDHFQADTLIIKHDEEYRSVEGGEPYVPPTGSSG